MLSSGTNVPRAHAASEVAALLRELEHSLGAWNEVRRSSALHEIASTFVGSEARLNQAQIEVFDQVIVRFLTTSKVPARIRLAEQLVAAKRGPSSTIRRLAHDEIDVARPLLRSSIVLGDQDLMAVALARGETHALAITERQVISPLLSGALLTSGSEKVCLALAANLGAKLATDQLSALVRISPGRQELQDALGRRHDLNDDHSCALVEATRRTVKFDIARTLANLDPAEFADLTPCDPEEILPPDPSVVAAIVERLAETGLLTDRTVADFAASGRRDEAVAVIARLTGLHKNSIVDLISRQDADTLLMIGRALDWGWENTRAIFSIFDPPVSDQAKMLRHQRTFDGLAASTAQKAFQFMRSRAA